MEKCGDGKKGKIQIVRRILTARAKCSGSMLSSLVWCLVCYFLSVHGELICVNTFSLPATLGQMSLAFVIGAKKSP